LDQTVEVGSYWENPIPWNMYSLIGLNRLRDMFGLECAVAAFYIVFNLDAITPLDGDNNWRKFVHK
jgi:hypothetical protein